MLKNYVCVCVCSGRENISETWLVGNLPKHPSNLSKHHKYLVLLLIESPVLLSLMGSVKNLKKGSSSLKVVQRSSNFEQLLNSETNDIICSIRFNLSF